MVTRGNVAIYCYNALTATTWDVTSSTDGKLTSSKEDTATILEKYFSDFTNKAGDMKLVEGLTVTATPITDKALGANQIVFADEIVYGETTVSAFLELKSNVKNKEEKTYFVPEDEEVEGDVDTVVAYVEPSACDSLAALRNKKVDVIFGKDNKIAYIAVTDNAFDGAFVTAWDGEVIEIDGEEYEFASASPVVTIFGRPTKETVATVIDDVLEIADPEDDFNRVLVANVKLNEDEEITHIDFMFAEDYSDETVEGKEVQVANYVVKNVTKQGIVNAINETNILEGKFETIEDTVRVIKDNEIVSLDVIEAGDVLTIVYTYAEDAFVVDTVYVASERAEGTVTRLSNSAYTLEGEDVYYTTKSIFGNLNGDIEKATSGSSKKDFYKKDAELYLNFMGEVVAAVATTEAVDTTLGIVTDAAREKLDDSKEEEVYYLSLKILTEDGTSSRYKIYSDKSTESYYEADDYNVNFNEDMLTVGAIVIFEADSNRVIKSDDIKVVSKYSYEVVDSADGALTVVADDATPTAEQVKLADAIVLAGEVEVGNYIKALATETHKIGSETVTKVVLDSEIDVDNKYKTVNGNEFRGAALFNTYDEPDTISGWDSLCTADDDHEFGIGDILFVNDEDEVVFYVGCVEDYSASETKYAVYVGYEYTTDEEDEDVYEITLYINGKKEVFETEEADIIEALEELTIKTRYFVSYTISDDMIETLTPVIKVSDLAKIDEDDLDEEANIIPEGIIEGVEDLAKGFLTVDSVNDDYVKLVKEYEGQENDAPIKFAIHEDGYIVYDLSGKTYKMVDDLSEVEGLLIYGFDSEGLGEGCDIFVILD